ncbi:MAG: DUF835 domain-containing protein, partial [Candidatus Methanofastidiosia archaeon]
MNSNLILALGVALQFTVGSYVLLKQPKRRINQLFLVIVVLIILVNLTNYLVEVSEDPLFWSRINLSFVCLIPALFIHITSLYSGRKLILSPYIFYLIGIAFLLFTPSEHFIKEVVVIDRFVRESYGEIFLFFSLYYGVTMLYGIFLLVQTYLQSNMEFQKNQAGIALIAVSLPIVVSLLQNIVSPILNLDMIKTSIIFSVTSTVMITIFAYGILRYKFWVVPQTEVEFKTEKEYQLEKGCSYLIEEERGERAFKVFVDAARHGAQALCISREFPEILRKKYDLEKTPMIWLASTEYENTILPEDLGKLNYLIFEFLKSSKNSIIILDGLEYLIMYNGFYRTLKFLHILRDLVVVEDSNLLVSLNPKVLSQR